MKKKISIIASCYNEEENVEEWYNQVKQQFDSLPNYDYEHIFIDNASKDKTVVILRQLAAKDKNVKLILNTKNFGHIRSPFYALMQAHGDAVVLTVADLQDPAYLITEFIKKWDEGNKVVIGIKNKSKEAFFMCSLRKLFYQLIAKSTSIEHISNFTGFGLYDQSFIDILRHVDDPYPYFRGLVAELAPGYYKIPYEQPARLRGKSKNNFYSLYDMAMLGFVNYSKLPLRLSCFIGFGMAIISLCIFR